MEVNVSVCKYVCMYLTTACLTKSTLPSECGGWTIRGGPRLDSWAAAGHGGIFLVLPGQGHTNRNTDGREAGVLLPQQRGGARASGGVGGGGNTDHVPSPSRQHRSTAGGLSPLHFVLGLYGVDGRWICGHDAGQVWHLLRAGYPQVHKTGAGRPGIPPR